MTASSHHYPITIIGGGLTGKMMALTLAHNGQEIALIAPPQTNKITDRRSTTIHHAGWQMLTALGLASALEKEAAPIHKIAVAIGPERAYHSDWLVTWTSANSKADTKAAAKTPNPMAYVVENHHLDTALSAALKRHKNIHHHQGFVTSFHDDQNAAMLETDDGTCLTSQLVIACDGTNSPLRTLAGLTPKIEETGQHALICDLRLEVPHHDTACQRFLPTGPIALMPLTGDSASLVWSTSHAEAARLSALEASQFSAELTAAFGQEFGNLTLAGEVKSFPLRPHYNTKLTKGRLVLAGDAAHAIHPLAGMGYNLALGDAAILLDEINTLTQNGLSLDHPSLTRAYHTRRLPEITAMSWVTKTLNKLLSRPKNPLSQMLAMGMAVMEKTPLKSALRDIAMGGRLSKAPLLQGRLK